MKEQEKLRILIPHWIEHNNEHAEVFRSWVEKSGAASVDLLAAAESISKTNTLLEAALEKIGGPLEFNLEG